MSYNIQDIVNMFIAFTKIGFPIALAMEIGIKLIHIFQDFVLGRDVRL